MKLSYFMDMSDREIGELLDMARRTVQHQRTDVLAERRKQILLSHEAEVKIHKRPWMICVLIQIGIVIDRISPSPCNSLVDFRPIIILIFCSVTLSKLGYSA